MTEYCNWDCPANTQNIVKKEHKDTEKKKRDSSVEYPDDCDLRCTKEKKQREYIEYIGPVHISLIDPPGYVYRRTMFQTALINFAYFLIGSTVMIPLYFTLSFKYYWHMNIHIFLVTLGSQICLPVSYLILHHLHGPSIWLKAHDKHKEACMLKFFGTLCIWSGTVFLYLNKDIYVTEITVHSFSGFAGAAMCIFNILTLSCSFADEDGACGKSIQFICLPAFLLCTISFITGLHKPTMIKWYPHEQMPFFLSILCICYTMIVAYWPIKKWLKML